MTSDRLFLKTVAARGLVNGRGPLRRSGRDLVFKNSLSLGVSIIK